ncbi:MAG TPA: hypothetical protein VGM18_07925 [Candidatus Sulfotelmatobacter sp.]|jgi:hypothetical protein
MPDLMFHYDRMILPSLATFLLVLVTVYAAVVSFRPRPEAGAGSWLFPDRATRPVRIVAGVLMLAFMFILGAWIGIGQRNSTPRSFRFLLPNGYTGWVRVEFEIPGAPPLKSENGRTVLEIPPDGSLRTSSPEQYGRTKDAYFFDSPSGLRPIPDSGPGRLIWGKVDGEKIDGEKINGEKSGVSGTRKYEEFFVGTEQQYRDQIKGTGNP